ncbi:helix-turn-helix domain-containing protein [Haladaptatus sp. NG-WS-4]
MNTATDPVLEALDETNWALPPKVLYYNLGLSRASVNRALQELLKRDFVEKPKDAASYYQITEKGRAYLMGEIDASNVEAKRE